MVWGGYMWFEVVYMWFMANMAGLRNKNNYHKNIFWVLRKWFGVV